MGSTNSSYSNAIVHESNTYYMFDPRSRNEAVMPTPDDCAVLTHRSIVIRHLSALLDRKKDIPFEVDKIHQVWTNI